MNVFHLFSPHRSFFYSLSNHFSSKTMVKVLIIGAAGYIGLHLSQQLRRANHIVYGTTRSASKQTLLQTNEIIPIIGPIEVDHHQPAAWIEAIKTRTSKSSSTLPPSPTVPRSSSSPSSDSPRNANLLTSPRLASSTVPECGSMALVSTPPAISSL